MDLNTFFHENPRVAIGFSGGVDSAYLLYAGIQAGATICPYYIKTAFQPEFELEDAKKLANQLGVDLKIIELNILSHEEVARNPENRCYFCKQALFGALKEQALKDGYQVLLDGTNASDDVNDRPGMKALTELSVLSPLRICGLTKDEIRKRSKEAGLFTWDKPAYACLATRIPTDTKITEDMLRRVEGAEAALFELGFTDFRVRVFHGAARLQMKKEQMSMATEKATEIRQRLLPFFDTIMMDLAGR